MHKNNEFYKEKGASYQKVAKQSGLGAPGPKLPLRRRSHHDQPNQRCNKSSFMFWAWGWICCHKPL